MPGDVTPSRVSNHLGYDVLYPYAPRGWENRAEVSPPPPGPIMPGGKLPVQIRIHDCRHSFASRALALGESLPVIAKLLGHSQIRTTARYAHLARDSVRASAARVAASIAEDFLKGGSATAKLPGRKGTDSPG